MDLRKCLSLTVDKQVLLGIMGRYDTTRLHTLDQDACTILRLFFIKFRYLLIYPVACFVFCYRQQN